MIIKSDRCRQQARKGLSLATLIMLGWLVSLIGCLSLDFTMLRWWQLVALILLRTLLQTGLFIVGHDAMHHVLWPLDRGRNDTLGAMALMLYAALPYKQCHVKHQRHHLNPATDTDPDSPSKSTAGLFRWYYDFMAGYLSLGQMALLLTAWAAVAVVMAWITPSAPANVLLFCTLPLLLSSWQLFMVGTYLPHRNQLHASGHGAPESLDLHPWLSLLACFHFGYHREHHDNPGLPWFDLPAVRQRATSSQCVES